MESNEPFNFEHSTFHNPTYTTRIVLQPPLQFVTVLQVSEIFRIML